MKMQPLRVLDLCKIYERDLQLLEHNITRRRS